MEKVFINNVQYVPLADIKQPNDSAVTEALETIIETLYHTEVHKAYPRMWNILERLSPELYELAKADINAAYDRMHPDDSY
jgi:hypothetical protein